MRNDTLRLSNELWRLCLRTVLMDCIQNARNHTEFSVSCVRNKHLYLSSFLQVAMIPARRLTCVFLSMKDVKTLPCIGCCRAAFDSVRSVIHELSGSSVAKKATACASLGFGMFLFCSKKAEVMQWVFVVLLSWADASTSPKNVLTELMDPSTFSIKSQLELFLFIRSIFRGE